MYITLHKATKLKGSIQRRGGPCCAKHFQKATSRERRPYLTATTVFSPRPRVVDDKWRWSSSTFCSVALRALPRGVFQRDSYHCTVTLLLLLSMAAAIIVLRGHYHRHIRLGLAALLKSNTGRDGEAWQDVIFFP